MIFKTVIAKILCMSCFWILNKLVLRNTEEFAFIFLRFGTSFLIFFGWMQLTFICLDKEISVCTNTGNWYLTPQDADQYRYFTFSSVYQIIRSIVLNITLFFSLNSCLHIVTLIGLVPCTDDSTLVPALRGNAEQGPPSRL